MLVFIPLFLNMRHRMFYCKCTIGHRHYITIQNNKKIGFHYFLYFGKIMKPFFKASVYFI